MGQGWRGEEMVEVENEGNVPEQQLEGLYRNEKEREYVSFKWKE